MELNKLGAKKIFRYHEKNFDKDYKRKQIENNIDIDIALRRAKKANINVVKIKTEDPPVVPNNT